MLMVFQRPQDAQPSPKGTILGAWGLSLNKRFGGVVPCQNRKYVHICIACYNEYDPAKARRSRVALRLKSKLQWEGNRSAVLRKYSFICQCFQKNKRRFLYLHY